MATERASAATCSWVGPARDLALPTASIPNGAHLPYYRQVNLGVSHDFDRRAQGTDGSVRRHQRLWIKKYEIRNGTGVGVGAPQYGPRRGYFVGISQSVLKNWAPHGLRPLQDLSCP